MLCHPLGEAVQPGQIQPDVAGSIVLLHVRVLQKGTEGFIIRHLPETQSYLKILYLVVPPHHSTDHGRFQLLLLLI